jgi:hypothetical protein
MSIENPTREECRAKLKFAIEGGESVKPESLMDIARRNQAQKTKEYLMSSHNATRIAKENGINENNK